MTAPPYYYSYDRHDFFYVGEEIANLDPIEGRPLLPASATWIEPPLKDRDSVVIAVFSHEHQAWTIEPNNFWQPPRKRREVNLGNVLNGDLTIIQLDWLKIKRYRSIPRLLNGNLINLYIAGRLQHLQATTASVLTVQASIANAEGVAPELLCRFHMLMQDVVVQMKKLVDEIFVYEWIEKEIDTLDFRSRHPFEISGVNDICKARRPETLRHLQSLRDQSPAFFKTLIDVRNACAHHFLFPETMKLFHPIVPTVEVIYMPNGTPSEIEIIDVLLEDLIKSFNKFVIATIAKQQPA